MLPFEKKNEKHTQLPSDVLTPNATIDSLSREIKSFTGVSADAPYEPPPHPEINLPNYKMTIDESVDLLVSELRKAGVLSGGPTNPMGLPMPSGYDGYFLEDELLV